MIVLISISKKVSPGGTKLSKTNRRYLTALKMKFSLFIYYLLFIIYLSLIRACDETYPQES